MLEIQLKEGIELSEKINTVKAKLECVNKLRGSDKRIVISNFDSNVHIPDNCKYDVLKIVGQYYEDELNALQSKFNAL